MGDLGTNYVTAKSKWFLRRTLSTREVLHFVALVVLLLVGAIAWLVSIIGRGGRWGW